MREVGDKQLEILNNFFMASFIMFIVALGTFIAEVEIEKWQETKKFDIEYAVLLQKLIPILSIEILIFLIPAILAHGERSYQSEQTGEVLFFVGIVIF